MSKDLSNIQAASDEVMKGVDAIILVDRSGSMGDPSMRFEGKSKWDELKEDTTAIAREFAKYDDDGLTIISFSSSASVHDGVKADAVAKLFAENSPRGSTNLAAALNEANKKVRASKKQCVVMCFTDGSPDNQESAMAAIEAAGKEFGRPRVGFVFVQVGNDAGAKAFLDRLDNDTSVDVVATVSAKDAETLSAPQFVTLAQTA